MASKLSSHRLSVRQVVAALSAILVPVTAPAASIDDVWTLSGESTILYINRHLLADMGIALTASMDPRAVSHFDTFEFVAAPASPQLQVVMPRGSFERLSAGTLRHEGGFELSWQGGQVALREFELHPSSRLYTFALRGEDGSPLFFLDYPHTRYLKESGRVVFMNMDLRIAPELAERLARPELEGVAIGEGHVITEVAPDETPQGEQVCTPDFEGKVDVALTGLGVVSEVYHDTERVAMAPSAELENVGTADIDWFQSIEPDEFPSGAEIVGQHPFLAMHLYRLADGVMHQIGRSDLKHAFFAANLDCSCAGDQVLFTGCKDLYASSTNAWQKQLAPRTELTASSGDWTSLGSHFDGEPVDDFRDHDTNDHADDFEHRLTATTADLLTPDATYFIEAWYLAKGDIDIFNSMGYRGVAPQPGNPWTFPFTGPELEQGSVLDAWIDPAAIPPGATTTTVDTGLGNLKLAVQTTPLEDGFYHYELALMNLDFDRQIRSLTVALPDGAVVRSPGFDDVDNNLGNDWQLTVDTDAATWATDDGDPTVNALDWGTLYNFRFDTNVEPADAELTLGVLEPGDPTTLQVAAKVPGASVLAFHSISLSKSGSGTVLSEPAGIDCGLDCQDEFVEGVDLSLTGVPDAGHQLANWQEDNTTLTESSLYSFDVLADRELIATFEPCPSRRTLSPAIVVEEAVFQTCQVLVTDQDFRIAAPTGDVTFRAGEGIALGDGFVVESGASFGAVIDPKLLESAE